MTNTLWPSAQIGSCKVKQQGYCCICIYTDIDTDIEALSVKRVDILYGSIQH